MGESEKPDTAPEIKKQYNTLIIAILSIAFISLLLVLFLNRDRFFDSKQSAAVDERTELEKLDDSDNTQDQDIQDQASLNEEDDEDEEDLEIIVEEDDEEEFVEEVEYYPDLYVKSYEFDDDPEENEEVELEIVIANKGNEAAYDFHWEWWPDEDGKECGAEIDELGAGDSETVYCEYTYDSPDTVMSQVLVDPEDNVEESDEENNTYKKQVTPEEEQIADLYVKDYSFSVTPEKNVPFDAIIIIENQGNVDAEDFWWEWWPTYASYACREEISVLEAGEEVEVRCEDYVYGGWSNYKTSAIVDVDDDVTESDETNNEQVEYVVPIH